MKRRYFFGLLYIFALTAAVFSQSVTVTPKKTTYRRPKPLLNYKKSFVVIRPQISGLSPALNKKIESAISYEKISNLNIQEELREIQWLEEADYVVDYNKNGILVITLSLSGSGAYPSMYNTTVVVDLKKGNRVTPVAVFSNLGALAAKIKKAQQAEIKEAREEYKKDPETVDFDGSEYFRNADFKIENLNEFSVNDQGTTFFYDYGFPHVVQALQPGGRFFFSWAELKPHVRRDGLFGKFIR